MTQLDCQLTHPKGVSRTGVTESGDQVQNFIFFCSLDVLRAALRNFTIFPVETKVV